MAEIAIHNLIKNAIRYNTDPGHILIRVKTSLLAITNTSQLGELDDSKVFQRFYRTKPEHLGSGLGLAIVKEISDSHGWKVCYSFAGKRHSFTMEKQKAYSGNVKWNNNFSLPNDFNIQLTGIYLAPDLLPQGRIDTRFSVDFGLTKSLQNGKGELFVNGSDIFNTLRIKREIRGDGFDLVSTDFFQTQVFRVGYNYRF